VEAWPVWLILSILMLLVQLVEPSGHEFTRYDRAAVAAGELWRLLTAHLAHLDDRHLGVNLAGLWLLAFLFRHQFTITRALIVTLASMLLIDAGLYFILSGLDWYVGLSGVLHGIWAAGAIGALWVDRQLGILSLGLLALKLGYEQLLGPLPLSGSASAVVYQAHLFGACGGSFFGLSLRYAAR
jgi:rhomboid family GlyGly-CTERM serine protease